MSLRNTERFELVAKLGEGGAGIVYEVYDRLRDMPVALKLLREVSAEEIFRFKREFRVLANLSHANIVTLYDLVHEQDQWLFTMELVRGEDFLGYVRPPGAPEVLDPDTGELAVKQRLELSAAPTRVEPVVAPTVELPVEPAADSTAKPAADSTLESAAEPVTEPGIKPVVKPATNQPSRSRPATEPPAPSPPRPRNHVGEIVDLSRLRAALAQLADALSTLHAAGIVHRDLKPSNVRVTPEGRVVLMDFGIASEAGRERDLQKGTLVIGTPEFMAPEQVNGRQATAASDWFSFGALMYLSLTGHLPHGDHRWESAQLKQHHDPIVPSLRVSGIPPELEDLTTRLLARDPRARPQGPEVAQVLGLRSTPALRGRSEPTDGGEIFVGREQELARLAAIFHRVRDGEAGCVLVLGHSGIGKSSLVEQFLRRRRADSPSLLILQGRSHERESLAYRAFDGVVDALCHYLVNLPPEQQGTVLPDDAALLARLFPVLLAVPGCRSDHSQRWRDPSEVKREAVTALRQLLSALARPQPVVVHTDDLQWTDAESLALLQSLVRPPVIPGLLVIATIRTEDLSGADPSPLTRTVAALDQMAHCLRIDVGPLGEQEQEALTHAMVERQGGSLASDVEPWRSSAGHPMMLADVLRHMLEFHDDTLPARSLGLEQVILARVARLSEPARRLLEVVAVAGEPTPALALGTAADLDHEQRERATVELRHTSLARISVRDQVLLDSYHDKIRAALTTHLGDRTRALHEALAHALAQGAYEGVSPSTIASHWLACGRGHDAAFYLVEAARIAEDKLAFERADALRKQVLELVPDDIESHPLAALRTRALIGLVHRLRVTDHHHQALEHLAAAEAIASAHALIEPLATIHYLRGSVLFPQGDIEGCVAAHQQACRYATQAGSAQAQARALSGLGDADYMRGHMRSAYRHFSRCIELCVDHELVEIQVGALPMVGWTRLFSNELDAARRLTRDAMLRADEVGHRRAAVICRCGCYPQLLLEMNRLDEAQHELTRGMQMAHELGARRFEAEALSNLGQLMTLRGDYDQAVVLIERGLALCRQTGFSYIGPWLLAKLAAATRDHGRRRDALAEAEAWLAAGTLSHNHLYFYRESMDTALDMNEPARIERYADALERYTTDEPLPFADLFVARGRALAAHARDRSHREPLRAIHRQTEQLGYETAARLTHRLLGEDA